MNIFEFDWNNPGPPVYTNPENGAKFWFDKSLTQYATGKGLTGIRVFYVQEVSGYQTRVIYEGDNPVFSSQKFEDCAVHLDIMVLANAQN